MSEAERLIPELPTSESLSEVRWRVINELPADQRQRVLATICFAAEQFEVEPATLIVNGDRSAYSRQSKQRGIVCLLLKRTNPDLHWRTISAVMGYARNGAFGAANNGQVAIIWNKQYRERINTVLGKIGEMPDPTWLTELPDYETNPPRMVGK